MRNGKCRLSVELTPQEKGQLELQTKEKSEELKVDLSISEYIRWLIRQRHNREAANVS